MADTAVNDTSKTADAGTAADTTATKTATTVAPAAGQTQATTVTPKADAPQTFTVTADELAAAVDAAVEKRLTERTKGLEEAVAKRVTTPIEARGLIENFRAEMKAAGLYLAKDDDRTAEDESDWGDIASLDPADHHKVVRTAKDGTTVTKLQVAINRLRAQFKANRKPKAAGGDQLGTPPLETPANVFDDIRKETREKEAAGVAAREKGLNRVFNMAR